MVVDLHWSFTDHHFRRSSGSEEEKEGEAMQWWWSELRRSAVELQNSSMSTKRMLTVNVAALVINFVAAVSAGEVPLTAVQLLWVNLIMDTLGALALATEKPTEELIKKKPVVLLTLQFKGESIFAVNKRVNDTLIFNTFVLCQVFNEFNARNLEKKNVFEGIHKNKLFMAIIGITLVLQVVMVEFLKKFANTERLNWGQWGICIGFAAASWPIGWLVKCISVPDRPIFSYLRKEDEKAESDDEASMRPPRDIGLIEDTEVHDI
ncbi:Calcium-transporting ATPase 12, plasma membrane-type [Capsicum chinense]|nr:Calcium-transporting ATPase 12, plasma membrane-type [Capsicum chinense]